MSALILIFGAVMFGLGCYMGWMLAEDKRFAADDAEWWAALDARDYDALRKINRRT